MKLTPANLSAIAARVPVPGYDRSKLRAGIVHLGVGGFHRAHQAMYLDALFRESGVGGFRHRRGGRSSRGRADA